MNGHTRAAKGVIFTSLSALLYGTLPICAGLAYAAGSNASTFNFYKSLWALPVLIAVLLVKKQSIRLPARQLVLVIIAGILGKGITSLLLYSSYNYVSSGVATTLHFMYPLFSAILAFCVFRARLPAYKWLTLLVATAAAFLFVDLGDSSKALGVLAALASGLVYACYILLVDHSGLSGINSMVYAFYLALSGAVFSLIYGLCTDTMLFSVSLTSHFYMLLAAVLTSVVASACFQIGIRLLGGTSAAFFSILEPVGSCVFGAIFLHEAMNGRTLAGIILILASVVAMIWLDSRREKNAKREESVS